MFAAYSTPGSITLDNSHTSIAACYCGCPACFCKTFWLGLWTKHWRKRSVVTAILFSGIIGDLALPSKKACLWIDNTHLYPFSPDKRCWLDVCFNGELSSNYWRILLWNILCHWPSGVVYSQKSLLVFL